MLKEVYEIDAEGFIVERRVGELEEDNLITDFGDKIIISTELPQPLLFFKPCWNGTEWIEGESDVERTKRKAEQQLEAFLPSSEEITDAELEIKMITLLTELEVIQP